MKPADLPLPVVRRPRAPTDVGALERGLGERVDGEVRFDAGGVLDGRLGLPADAHRSGRPANGGGRRRGGGGLP